MGPQIKGKVYEFSGDCPKCLAPLPMSVYCQGCGMARGEHLDRMCLHCGFSWPAKTADGKPMERDPNAKRKGGKSR